MEKVMVQICFSIDDDMTKVREQLKELAKNPDLEFYSCHMPRHLVLEKGFSLGISDMLAEELTDRIFYAAEDCKTFKDFNDNLSEIRKALADKVNRMYVLGVDVATGIREEVELFTQRKVIIMG